MPPTMAGPLYSNFPASGAIGPVETIGIVGSALKGQWVCIATGIDPSKVIIATEANLQKAGVTRGIAIANSSGGVVLVADDTAVVSAAISGLSSRGIVSPDPVTAFSVLLEGTQQSGAEYIGGNADSDGNVTIKNFGRAAKADSTATVKSPLLEYNPKAYGAKADGFYDAFGRQFGTDDTPAWNAMIAAIQADPTPGKKKIRLPPGLMYMAGDPYDSIDGKARGTRILRIPVSCHLEGNGGAGINGTNGVGNSGFILAPLCSLVFCNRGASADGQGRSSYSHYEYVSHKTTTPIITPDSPGQNVYQSIGTAYKRSSYVSGGKTVPKGGIAVRDDFTVAADGVSGVSHTDGSGTNNRVFFRANYAVAPTGAAPALFTSATEVDIGTTFNDGAHVNAWTVESVPLDRGLYSGVAVYVGQRLLIPGDARYILEVVTAGTLAGDRTGDVGAKMVGSPSVTFTNATKKISRSAGSWINDGFTPDTAITVSGTASNNGNFHIAAGAGSVTDSELTLTTSPVNETAGAATIVGPRSVLGWLDTLSPYTQPAPWQRFADGTATVRCMMAGTIQVLDNEITIQHIASTGGIGGMVQVEGGSLDSIAYNVDDNWAVSDFCCVKDARGFFMYGGASDHGAEANIMRTEEIKIDAPAIYQRSQSHATTGGRLGHGDGGFGVWVRNFGTHTNTNDYYLTGLGVAYIADSSTNAEPGQTDPSQPCLGVDFENCIGEGTPQNNIICFGSSFRWVLSNLSQAETAFGFQLGPTRTRGLIGTELSSTSKRTNYIVQEKQGGPVASYVLQSGQDITKSQRTGIWTDKVGALSIGAGWYAYGQGPQTGTLGMARVAWGESYGDSKNTGGGPGPGLGMFRIFDGYFNRTVDGDVSGVYYGTDAAMLDDTRLRYGLRLVGDSFPNPSANYAVGSYRRCQVSAQGYRAPKWTSGTIYVAEDDIAFQVEATQVRPTTSPNILTDGTDSAWRLTTLVAANPGVEPTWNNAAATIVDSVGNTWTRFGPTPVVELYEQVTALAALSSSPAGPLTVVGRGISTVVGIGGSGQYTYSIPTNNSGGTYVGGLYTAGATGNVDDTLRITDAITGSTFDVTIHVWSPANFAANLSAWYNETRTVSQWTDSSGGGYHLVQATGANQPTLSTINGHPSLNFAGDPTRMASAAAPTPSGAFTCWGIFKATALDFDAIFGGPPLPGNSTFTSAGVYAQFSANTNDKKLYLGHSLTAGKFARSNAALDDSAVHRWIGVWSGATWTLYIDGVAQTTVGTDSTAPGAGDGNYYCAEARSGASHTGGLHGDIGQSGVLASHAVTGGIGTPGTELYELDHFLGVWAGQLTS